MLRMCYSSFTLSFELMQRRDHVYTMKNKLENVIIKLKKHRFLFSELVKRDFKQKYKRTVLGIGWSLLSPLLMLLVMKVIFTQFFGRNTPHYTIYIFCGNIVWSFVSEATTGGMRALMDNAAIFTKVNVPKYLFVFSKNIQSCISFLLTILILFVFVAFDTLPFTWMFLALIYPVVLVVCFNIGCGMILSGLFVFFRDTEYLYEVFLRLLLYCSAIFYQVDNYSSSVQRVFLANPVYLFIKYFRNIIIDGAIPSLQFHLLMLFETVILVFLGCLMYKKNNTKFLYYV